MVAFGKFLQFFHFCLDAPFHLQNGFESALDTYVNAQLSLSLSLSQRSRSFQILSHVWHALPRSRSRLNTMVVFPEIIDFMVCHTRSPRDVGGVDDLSTLLKGSSRGAVSGAFLLVRKTALKPRPLSWLEKAPKNLFLGSTRAFAIQPLISLHANNSFFTKIVLTLRSTV